MEENKSGKKIKILIVDDEPIRTTYSDVFKAEGFEVIEATDGVEGLNKAIAEVPDVILTGIIMPKMDGFALKDALVKNVSTANIPVLMSSHMGREEDRKKAIEIGVKEFFVLGMITPKKVVEEIHSMFSAKKYHLNFNAAALDASRLESDFHFENGFVCEKCGKQRIISLEIADVIKKEFKARFICPECK